MFLFPLRLSLAILSHADGSPNCIHCGVWNNQDVPAVFKATGEYAERGTANRTYTDYICIDHVKAEAENFRDIGK